MTRHLTRVRPGTGHPQYLTRSAERGAAAGMIEEITGAPAGALHTADMLDLIAGAALSAAGVADPEAQRAILAVLWRDLDE